MAHELRAHDHYMTRSDARTLLRAAVDAFVNHADPKSEQDTLLDFSEFVNMCWLSLRVSKPRGPSAVLDWWRRRQELGVFSRSIGSRTRS